MRTSWSLLAVLALATAGCAGDDSCKCNKSIAKYYAELNCRPIKEDGACCPTKYDCPDFQGDRSKEKCYLKGKAYDLDATIPSAELEDTCIPDCRCKMFGPQASLHCSHNDCPELFRGRLEEGCVRLYSPDSCCSTGTHCASTPAAKDSGKCEYGGETYVLGQKFYPEEEPCKTCICEAGFDGSLDGPWCREFSCGYEVHYGARIQDGCVPLLTSGCCPFEWRCPSEADAVVPAASNKRTSASAGTCTFGSLRLNVGDTLSKENECVECSCTVPPHVTCVKEAHC